MHAVMQRSAERRMMAENREAKGWIRVQQKSGRTADVTLYRKPLEASRVAGHPTRGEE